MHRYYVKNKNGRVENAPYVDNSYKYAGGGFISTAADLCKFGNAMLYSYQCPPSAVETPGFLKPETVKALWTPVENTKCFWNPDGAYGMGWCVVPYRKSYGECREQRFIVNHTGAAIGASSVLLLMPRKQHQQQPLSTAASHRDDTAAPAGIVVAMICNVQNAGLNKTAQHIADIFEKL